jgi:hypothetical protein
MMTDLSPAAQAVLDAFRAVPDLRDCPSIAAALRAAADQVLAATWEGQIQPDATHMLGINWTRDALYTIAAELDGNA